LSFVFNTLMRALHPIAPFVTEEIWQQLPHDGATIVTASWPDTVEIPRFPVEAAMYEAFIESIVRIRNARAELDLKPNERVTLRSAPLPAPIVEQYAALARAHIEVDRALPADRPLAELLAQIEIVADPTVLRERYTREIATLDDEVTRLEKKLANENFVARAKADVVAGEREKLDGYRRQRDQTRTALEALPTP
jgi:valyl-tRNA synthetase